VTANEYYQTTGGSAAGFPVPPDIVPEKTLSPGQWGMLAFLFSEVAFFSTLIVAYVTFKGEDTVGPTPGEVLSLKLVIGTTACLLASSLTVHLATRALEHGSVSSFTLWWAATIALGVAFLAGTGYEWYGLIVDDRLTISRNLFGSTFYTLVGFHALHVTVGVIAMLVVLGLALVRRIAPAHAEAPQLVSWYWHFVDGVWIVVFAIVYLS
jgi:cytochrome c oxidase subunit 3/cytochrome o ubiquinol oxidase subunit 3